MLGGLILLDFMKKFTTFFLPHVVRVYNMRCSDEGLSGLVRVHGAAILPRNGHAAEVPRLIRVRRG